MIEVQFDYVTNLAKQYQQFSQNETSLFDAINKLPQSILENILAEYGNSESDFKPVNLLRAAIARQLLGGMAVDKSTVEAIKSNIRDKDTTYFSDLEATFLTQMQNYRVGNRDMFANWQKMWSVFYTFFYRGQVKETTQLYLEQIGNDLLQQLQLNDYSFHWVDFQGPNNFGACRAWLALYPINILIKTPINFSFAYKRKQKRV
jgi:5-methylcytosine-specific restriction enzyme B